MLCFALHPNEASMLLFKGNKARLGAVAFMAGIDPRVMDLISWHGTGEDTTICLFA